MYFVCNYTTNNIFFTFFNFHPFEVFSPEAMEIVTGEHEEPLFPPKNSLTHHSLESINHEISNIFLDEANGENGTKLDTFCHHLKYSI